MEGGGVKIVNNEDKREEMKIEKLDEGTRVKYCYRKRNNLSKKLNLSKMSQ